MLDKAIKLATLGHTGQTRSNGDPYIFHPLRVMARVALNNPDNPRLDELMQVAVLHDVIEDCNYSFSMLRAHGFSYEVAMAVFKLSKSKDVDYSQYLETVKMDPLARLVKIADMEDNSNIEEVPLEKRERFQKRIETKYRPGIEYLRAA